MPAVIAKYQPGKQQSVLLAAGDTLWIPTYGLAVDLVFNPIGSMTGLSLWRVPSANESDLTTSLKILLAPGGTEDPGGYITALQTVNPGTAPKDFRCPEGQDAWVVTPGGTTVQVVWTLRRPKVDTPDFQP